MNESLHRKSLRLPSYDYSSAGWYFITICTREKHCLFGEIIDGKMKTNEVGKIIEEEWKKTPMIRNTVSLDHFQIMPNHFHGIIVISNRLDGAYAIRPYKQPLQSPGYTLGAIIRGYKSATSRQVNTLTNNSIVSLWQRNYYEHIIRNDKDLARIREYITNNPQQWELDQENPKLWKKPFIS